VLKPTAIDTIIQSSTVEILRAYDISVAPRARAEVVGHVPDSDVVGIIAFEGADITGNLTLAVPISVCHTAIPKRARGTTHAEWTYEITNQVMGSIKNRLVQFQVKLRTHVPTVLSGVALERHKSRTAAEVLYCFAALRGDVSLTVDVSLARAPLDYSNAALLVNDNDPILFG
jgi:CheY-specific phosphatase CheX